MLVYQSVFDGLFEAEGIVLCTHAMTDHHCEQQSQEFFHSTLFRVANFYVEWLGMEVRILNSIFYLLRRSFRR